MGLSSSLPRQGDVWWAETEYDRRPVLIVSRSHASAILNRLVVAPVFSNVRGIPTEIALGEVEGMPHECAASFDNLMPQRVDMLTTRIGRLGFAQHRICRALEALADC